METKMSIMIVIKNPINSKELYNKLSYLGVNVTDMGEKTYVHAQIDIKDDVVEKIINTCQSYGDCDVSAHRVKEG